MWTSQLQALAAWRPVVSDAATRHDTIETMAAALLAQHAGDLVLCGASMGGIVAMEVARQAPERVRGLALLGTNARPETAEMRALRESAIVLFEQGRAEEVIRANVAFAFHPRHADDATRVDLYLRFVLDAGSEQLVRQNRALIERPDARPHLPRLRCPTLVLCGDSDQLTPPEASREIAALVPHAELVMVPECGHMLTLEQPERVNAELVRWLKRSLG